jgi:hypothetical protein
VKIVGTPLMGSGFAFFCFDNDIVRRKTDIASLSGVGFTLEDCFPAQQFFWEPSKARVFS